MTGQKLYQRAKLLIPGGTQLVSKRPEMFAPDVWPAYYSKAKGAHVWDMDGNKFVDMGIMNVGACILGYADEDVDRAVIQAVNNGVSSSLNCPEEIELAELLIEIHPWAEMIRYARSGGEAMSIAVRIARAATQRNLVMFSGYHGWADWYLAANLGEEDQLDGHLMAGIRAIGVPSGLNGSSLSFPADDVVSLKEKIRGQEKNLAAIIIEPARAEGAAPNYLNDLKSFSEEVGAVLIFDEITSGFRMNAGGLHLKYGTNPDISVFAKSMANGYAMSALIGVERVMQAAQSTFISSTNWTERIGPTASIATIRKYMRCQVDRHILSMGNKVMRIWEHTAERHGLKIKVVGLPSLASFFFCSEENMTMQTFFTIKMLEYGFLAFRQFKPSFAHTEEQIERYSEAVDIVFRELANRDHDSLLSSPVAHAGLQRLAKV